MRNQPEQALQRAIVEYLSAVLTERSWFTSIPAGGGGRIRGAVLKATGYRKGTPDLLIVHDGKAHWMEVKSEKGRLSPDQAAIHLDLAKAGCIARVQVVRSIDEVRGYLYAWNIPTKERTL